MTYGKTNIVAGLLLLAAFMIYGFGLIYLRDFAPGAEQWIAEYASGTHFESRLAHVHGNLFAFLNIMIGYLFLTLRMDQTSARWVSGLAMAGMLMPLGIVAEFALGAPPYFVFGRWHRHGPGNGLVGHCGLVGWTCAECCLMRTISLKGPSHAKKPARSKFPETARLHRR